MKHCRECGGFNYHFRNCPNDPGYEDEGPAEPDIPDINEDDNPREREYDYAADLDRVWESWERRARS